MSKGLKHTAFAALGAAAGLLHRKMELRAIRRFVVLEYMTALGAAVHATPLVPALRAAVPGAEITVVGSGLGAEIFRGNPGVSRVIETPNPIVDLRGAVAGIRRALPRGTPFATLAPVFNERSTIALAAVLAGAQNLVGFTLVPELFRDGFAFDPTRSQIANNLRIVEALGHPAAKHYEPQVFFGADDLAHARRLVSRFAEPARSIAVLVTQTSVTQRKSWRPERFQAVAKRLGERHGMNVLLVGSKGERAGVEALAAGMRGAQNVAGETNLPQLAALLSLCRVGVSLDTGTMHVGRAVGLPMVIVAPAWSPVGEWLPVGDPRYAILKNLDMAAAPEDYVIDEVSVDEVNAAVDRLLATRDGVR